MKKKLFLKAFFIFLFFVQISNLWAFDLTSVQDSLSDFFKNLTGDNEGTTSYRSLLIPTGGRMESLGSAYTGLCDDISFLDSNPAASALMKNTELAVFHNSWIADSAMETLAGTFRNNNYGFGGKLSCFYVPFTEYDAFGERVAGSYYSETTALFNMSYNFLSGYDFKGLAFGGNLKACYRSMPDYTDNDTGEIITNSGLEQSGLAVMADLGMMLQFNAGKFYASRDTNLKIGLSLTNLGAGLTGFTKSSGITLDDPLPSAIALGVSYKFNEPSVITFEFKQPVNLMSLSEYQMFSTGLGFEYKIMEFFSLAGGLLIKGGNPRISFGGNINFNKISLNANYTFDLTSSGNPVNHISLSAKLNLGDRGRQKIQDRIDQLYLSGIAHYSKGEYEEAIKNWQEVLKLNKRYDPAINGIFSAESQLDMFKKIIEIQSFDTSM